MKDQEKILAGIISIAISLAAIMISIYGSAKFEEAMAILQGLK
jgi:hypothetical protein